MTLNIRAVPTQQLLSVGGMPLHGAVTITDKLEARFHAKLCMHDCSIAQHHLSVPSLTLSAFSCLYLHAHAQNHADSYSHSAAPGMSLTPPLSLSNLPIKTDRQPPSFPDWL